MRAYPLLALGRYDEAIRESDIAIEFEARIPRSARLGHACFPARCVATRSPRQAGERRPRRCSNGFAARSARARESGRTSRSCCTGWDATMRHCTS